jgi:Fe-S-cluster containining protein
LNGGPDQNEAPNSVPHSDFIDVYDDLRWKCINCGTCCGNVYSRTWLDVSLTDYIQEPVDGYCPKFDVETHHCRIHDKRPNVCRGYPFIIRKSGDHYKLQIHKRCKGIGQGPVIDIEEKVLELVKYCEEELDIDFIVRKGDDGKIKMYRVK